MASRCALPPGIYSIQNTKNVPRGIAKAVISPANQGDQFTLGQPNINDPKQQWIVAANGSIMPMIVSASDQHAWTTSPALTTVGVTRNATPYNWVINVKPNTDNTFSGWIMSKDPAKLFWTPNTASNFSTISMGATAMEWNFVPLPPV